MTAVIQDKDDPSQGYPATSPTTYVPAYREDTPITLRTSQKRTKPLPPSFGDLTPRPSKSRQTSRAGTPTGVTVELPTLWSQEKAQYQGYEPSWSGDSNMLNSEVDRTLEEIEQTFNNPPPV